MGAHMVGRLDVLCIDAMLRLPFDVLHFEWRVVRPEIDVLVEGLRQIVGFHGIEFLVLCPSFLERHLTTDHRIKPNKTQSATGYA